MNYKDAGVDIDAGNSVIEKIAPIVEKTFDNNVLTGLGGFGGLYQLPLGDYVNPILVSGTDGVGTKLKLALDFGIYDKVGIDLVAMSVNDVITTGADPLFFLDYYATGKLIPDIAASIISGIARGCELAGCSLIGGETAEVPGMYHGDDYDLAGFCVGVVSKPNLITPSNIITGDVLIGIPSSGPHSNGYSLIRKILDSTMRNPNHDIDRHFLDKLLAPTAIYAKIVADVLEEVDIHGMAHITGGGLTENIPRMVPPGCSVELDTNMLVLPSVFKWIQDAGEITDEEMRRTFNCGIGMVICVGKHEVDRALDVCECFDEKSRVIGEVVSSAPSVTYR